MTPEYVYSDVPYHAGRVRRLQNVLTVAQCFIVANGLIFVAIGISTAAYGMVALQGAFAGSAAIILGLRHRVDHGVAMHVTFWLALIMVVANLLYFEGMSPTARPVSHAWFAVLVVAIGLIMRRHSRAWLRVYVGLCFGLFVFVEFSNVTILPLLPPDPASYEFGRSVARTMQFVTLVAIVFAYVREISDAETFLTAANGKLESLLENMLPPSISERLRAEGHTFADGYANCSVLFADIVGFTPMSAEMPPMQVVNLLDKLFSEFDSITEECGLEKIKTIGDSYMVAAGLPIERSDHATALVELALRLKEAIRAYPGLGLRIGINSGEVVAGIIGRKRYIYDLWGDTVNIASRMESHGLANEIQVSAATYRIVRDHFECEPRGEIQVKGRGPLDVYLVKGRA